MKERAKKLGDYIDLKKDGKIKKEEVDEADKLQQKVDDTLKKYIVEATGDPKITEPIVTTATKLKERAEKLGENYIDLKKDKILVDEVAKAEDLKGKVDADDKLKKYIPEKTEMITQEVVDAAKTLQVRAVKLGENYIDLTKDKITEDEIIAAEKANKDEENLKNIYQN